jgi:hypothetical protein
MMAKPKAKGFVHYADMTGAAKAKRTAELLKNPGTRSLVATKDLPKGYSPAFKAKRELADKFRAPITEGSSLTYGQVASDSKDAANVQFGPNAIQNSQQLEKDTAGWYDDFQKQLAQHTQNTVQYGQQANAASLGLQNAEGMTAANDPSAENQQVFANARAVRQGLNAAYGSQIADNAASANRYASLRQNVVAPGNKIGALLGAKKATGDLQAKIGAYQQEYRDKVRQSEAQNVLAQGIAQGKTAAQLAKIASDNLNKRATRVVTKRGQDLTAQTAADRLAAKQAADKAKDAAKPKKSDYAARDTQNTFRDKYVGGLEAAREQKGHGVSEAQMRTWLISGRAPTTVTAKDGTKVKIPGIEKAGSKEAVEAILDVVYRGGRLSPATVKMLHRRGIKVSTLGAPTVASLSPVDQALARLVAKNPVG